MRELLSFPVCIIGGGNAVTLEGRRYVANLKGEGAAVFYPVDLLRPAHRLFKQAAVFDEHWQNIGLTSNRGRAPLGFITHPVWCEADLSVYALLEPLNPAGEQRIIEARDAGQGVSGNYFIDFDTAGRFRYVTRIKNVWSVDLVGSPTAGGGFITIRQFETALQKQR